MEPQGTPRPWYKKKLTIAIVGLVGLVTVVNLGSDNSSLQTSTKVTTPIVSQPATYQIAPLQVNTVPKQQNSPSSAINSELSNDNYYTNTKGNEVHSPAYSKTVPVGASAQCRDGTYSFSQSRRGTCSHHRGVAEWL